MTKKRIYGWVPFPLSLRTSAYYHTQLTHTPYPMPLILFWIFLFFGKGRERFGYLLYCNLNILGIRLQTPPSPTPFFLPSSHPQSFFGTKFCSKRHMAGIAFSPPQLSSSLLYPTQLPHAPIPFPFNNSTYFSGPQKKGEGDCCYKVVMESDETGRGEGVKRVWEPTKYLEKYTKRGGKRRN